jgi:hypothetical protein
MDAQTTTEKTYSPRYSTQEQRDRNCAYIRKYYYTNGGKEKKQMYYYFRNYPELLPRNVYDEKDDIPTRLQKIRDEITIIKMERKLKMRVITVVSTDEDTCSEKSDD